MRITSAALPACPGYMARCQPACHGQTLLSSAIAVFTILHSAHVVT